MTEAPPFQLTLHVTAGHRSAGTSRRNSILEASDLIVEQARFPVLFPRNVERDPVAGENRRDLNRFSEGGMGHNWPWKVRSRGRCSACGSAGGLAVTGVSMEVSLSRSLGPDHFRTNPWKSVPTINFHAAHEIHLVAVGSASRRLGSISSPQWAQMP